MMRLGIIVLAVASLPGCFDSESSAIFSRPPTELSPSGRLIAPHDGKTVDGTVEFSWTPADPSEDAEYIVHIEGQGELCQTDRTSCTVGFVHVGRTYEWTVTATRQGAAPIISEPAFFSVNRLADVQMTAPRGRTTSEYQDLARIFYNISADPDGDDIICQIDVRLRGDESYRDNFYGCSPNDRGTQLVQAKAGVWHEWRITVMDNFQKYESPWIEFIVAPK